MTSYSDNKSMLIDYQFVLTTYWYIYCSSFSSYNSQTKAFIVSV